MDGTPSDLPDPIRRAVEALDTLAAPEDGGSAELVWIQHPRADKYAHAGQVAIDCESRLHLCGAACCRLHFPLSEQDLDEGVVAWDPEHPYMIAHGSDDRCVHLDRTTRRCGVYARRPLPCRAFDCRDDPRIWVDFAKGIPNPDLRVDEGPAVEGPNNGSSA